MRPSRLIIALALLAFDAHSDDRVDWSVELLIGDAYNAASRTRIEQVPSDGHSFNGDYETRGLESPLHYAGRIARWEDARGWELQLLHHKIFLQNRPAGVEALSVSHGFNIVTLNRAIEYQHWPSAPGSDLSSLMQKHESSGRPTTAHTSLPEPPRSLA